MWYMYSMGYSSAVKKTKVMNFAGKMEPNKITLSGIT